MSNETLTLLTTRDDEQIALWQLADSTDDGYKSEGQNILLIHGTFSDKRVSLGIANYLVKLGHTCYIMEWRGHGASSISDSKFNFETIAFYDVAATFDYLFKKLNLTNLHAVTHSGGGICLTMFLTQNQHYVSKLNSITMIACQAYGAALNIKSYLKILLLKTMTRLLDHVPARRLKLGPINESYYTMRQWYNWNLNKNFQSSLVKPDSNAKKSAKDENFDYRQLMPTITTPIYAISAKGDDFIAPTKGCQLFFDSFNNSANVFREFSIDNGDLEDYDHSRIMLSRNAAEEVWPTVAAWIEGHSKINL